MLCIYGREHAAGADVCVGAVPEAFASWPANFARRAILFAFCTLRSFSVRPDVYFWVPDLRDCSLYSSESLCSWIELASLLSQFRIFSVSVVIESRCCCVAGKFSDIADAASEIFGRPTCQINFAIIALPQRLRSAASALLLFSVKCWLFCVSVASFWMKSSMY